MKVDFDKWIDRRNTNCTKYDNLLNAFGEEKDILPMWIADMDFPVPQEVTEALKKRTEHPVYGYNIFPDGYYRTFIDWQKKHHNWTVKEEWLCHTPGVLTALANAILSFTEKGDQVLIQPPVYFPFKGTIEALGRKVLNNQLIYKDGYFSIDFADLEEKAKKAALFVFCSPHNPSGRIWKEEELKRVEEICRKNDLLVFSDEIHSDIVYGPGKHIVFASVSEWSREHSVIAMAPSKTFNLAGLEMSFITIAGAKLRETYQHLLRYGLHVANGNSYGIAAAQAAYRYGEEWYRELLLYLRENIAYLDTALKEKVPQVRLVYPEAGYIPLLDMGELHLNAEELKNFCIHEVKAALNSGETFGPGGEQFMRINVATQRANLEEFVKRLSHAVEHLK